MHRTPWSWFCGCHNVADIDQIISRVLGLDVRICACEAGLTCQPNRNPVGEAEGSAHPTYSAATTDDDNAPDSLTRPGLGIGTATTSGINPQQDSFVRSSRHSRAQNLSAMASITHYLVFRSRAFRSRSCIYTTTPPLSPPPAPPFLADIPDHSDFSDRFWAETASCPAAG